MWGCCSSPHKCRCLYPSSFVLCESICNSVEFLLFDSKKLLQSENEKKVWVGLAWLNSCFEMDSKPPFLSSEQAELKSRLWSHASWSVNSQSSFFMIQIYRLYKMCAFILEPSYISYLISYSNGTIIVQNERHVFIHPSCTPCFTCVPCTIFWVFCFWQVHKEVSKNKVTARLTRNSIMGLQI